MSCSTKSTFQRVKPKVFFTLLCTLFAFGFASHFVLAQSVAVDRQVQINEIESATRQQLAQIASWLEAGETSEAIRAVARLHDEASGKMIASPASPLNLSFQVVRYQPIQTYLSNQRLDWQTKFPAAWEAWNDSQKINNQQQWDSLQRRPTIEQAKSWLAEARGTDRASDAWIALGDLYLLKGWQQAARDCFQQADRSMRAPVGGAANRVTSIPWNFVLRAFQEEPSLNDEVKAWLIGREDKAPPSTSTAIATSTATPTARRAALWGRLINCSLLDGDMTRARLELRVLRESFPQVTDNAKNPTTWLSKAQRWIEEAESRTGSERLAGSSTMWGGTPMRDGRLQFSSPAKWESPAWSESLPRYTGTSDSNPVGPLRTAEALNGLLVYHPVIDSGRVYVNLVNRVVAFDLKNGKSWPVADPAIPLFDTGIPNEALVPLGYPVVGAPRGTLSIHDSVLYARVGSPITGWKSRSGLKEGSTSSLIALDLKSEGKLLAGFPLRLTGESWNECEFEGSPLIIENSMFVVITQRTSVHLRRFVACFDRWNGRLRWRSQILAGGVPEGNEEANVISHQLLSWSDGRLFCDTGLGVIAALDSERGEVQWLVRHPQAKVASEAYPRSNRFRFRDMNPPMIVRDQVICAPVGCREIFSLDWGTGDLHWATDPDLVTDAIHFLGVQDDRIIVSGDAVYWLDLARGKLLAKYPSSRSESRCMGRGIAGTDTILAPTSTGKIYELQLDGKLRREYDLGIRGNEGGNLVAGDGWLVMTSPNRIMAWKIDTNEKQPTSIR